MPSRPICAGSGHVFWFDPTCEVQSRFCPGMKEKRHKEEIKLGFHLQFVAEIEGCHQSFPFLTISRRLEDKSRTSYEQTDEWVQFSLFGKVPSKRLRH